MRAFFFVFAAAANLAVVDAVSKELAVAFLKNATAYSVIPGFFDLAYVENRGCAWGMLQGQVWPLAIFALVTMAILVWKRRAVFSVPDGASKLRRVAVMLAEPILYAGIVGNLLDRLYRGCVIDFLDFYWTGTCRSYHFPCFNLADTFICVAAGILILCSRGRRIS